MLTVTDRYLEDGCSTGKRERLCRSRGGESCAFDGAMIVLQPIADTAHIVHGPIACCGNSWEGRGTLSNAGAPLHRMGFTTDMDEMDIIYGSEEKLLKAIIQTYRTIKPRAIFVYATCVSGLIGEDIEAVCREAGRICGVKVIPVNAPGFAGPKNLGNRIAGEVLLDHVIGTGAPVHNSPSPGGRGLGGRGTINLIGEYNIAGDLWNVQPLLEEAGIRVLSRITGDSTFEEITYAHRAGLNVVVCSRALINVAREMERRYGIPYVEVSFFGKTEMSKALRLISSKFKVLSSEFHLSDKVEAVIAREERRLSARLRQYAHLRGKKAVLYTGGVKSWSFISALLDLGIRIVAVGTKKSTFEDEEKMRNILGPDAPLVEDVSPASLLRLMRQNNADILVAGGRNLYLAMKEGFPFVDVNQERHIAYAGYDGLVNLAEQISNSIRFFRREPGVRSQESGARSQKSEVRSQNLKSGISINPLKHSQTIGAAIALQGIDRAVPVIHGAQGCNFLAKVLITKHFREPVALAGTKLFTEDVVMGGDDSVIRVVRELTEKQHPALIGILTSGLSEVRGDDMTGVIRKFKTQNSRLKIIHIPAPDYEGGMEQGYSGATEAVLRETVKPHVERQDDEMRGRINVLAGAHLTPADFMELREIIESFGLRPVILPDLSSLDGSRPGFSALSSGGVKLSEIEEMSGSVFTLAVGMSMEPPARFLYEKYGIEYIVLDSVAGLQGTDALMKILSALSGSPVSRRYLRQRDVLVDGMRDAHFYLSGKKVCTALEPDLAVQTSAWLREMAVNIELAVLPYSPRPAGTAIAKKIVIGDLFSVRGDFDLLISNSHAEDTAARLGVPLYQMGFPVYKILGYTTRVTIGYRGTLSMINDTANLLMKGVH
ncbi:MAG: nitrogenase iron-molybdenum cofactor biosynthesis protein NifE [Deferribacteres bacterium]|nr:nitrogenase iron-molybdenum cofactor biosynthesis protein NifE [Deferribacteres bacterium]